MTSNGQTLTSLVEARRRECSLGHWVSTVSEPSSSAEEFDLTPDRSAFFFLFTGGMSVTSIGLTVSNVTTIENLSRRSKVWTLAIYIGDSPDPSKTSYPFPIVAYPIPRKSSHDESTPSQSRVFAVLQTKPGENPFDLGSPMKNLQQVLGYTLWDWLLPIKPSPCIDHSSPVSIYPMGPVVDRLRRQAKDWSSETSGRRNSRHHRR